MTPKPKTASPTPLPPLAPLPRVPHPHPRNLPNPGNACYLNALLISLFADSDAHDGLLHASTPFTPGLRTVATRLRTGLPVSPPTITHLRNTLSANGWYPGTGQHDVTELLSTLQDLLRAPYIPLVKRLSHPAAPEDADTSAFTERVIWLDPPGKDLSVVSLLEGYFLNDIVEGLRRGGRAVSASVNRALLPFYTPLRETGESVTASRSSFDALVLPLAIGRYRTGLRKSRVGVHVPTAIPAARFVHGGPGLAYTLMLRSVICHLGGATNSGHYVCYTYNPVIGWRRWDDHARSVESVRGDVGTGLPERGRWKEEIVKDSYLVFYELVPGDGEERWRREDESVARHLQVEEDFRMAFCETVEGMLDMSPVSVRGG